MFWKRFIYSGMERDPPGGSLYKSLPKADPNRTARFMQLSLAGLLYSALTGLTLAGFYMLNKRASRAGRPLLVILWIFAFHLPVLALWTASATPLRVTPFYFVPGTAVLILTIAGYILTIRAITLSPFSLTVPVLGLCPVFTSLIGIPLLGEWPTSPQWIGIVLAVLGVMWLHAPPARPWDIFSFWKGFVKERGAPLVALAALIWAFGSPLDKLALREADPQFHALYVFGGFALALFVWLAWRGELPARPVRRRWMPLLFVTGALGGISYALQLLALQHTPAGPFEAIKRVTSQVMALALGALFFREKITAPKIIGIAILCVGVPLIVM
jgi:drug/metabolite transporter (DMT)-like permease